VPCSIVTYVAIEDTECPGLETSAYLIIQSTSRLQSIHCTVPGEYDVCKSR
jgi:hypothetical protein